MEHSDVFLSYRRKDVDFAKKVDEALKASGREVWVDWEDIPPGVEGFSDEIQRGIEGANAMVAVLSPNYIESEYCLMELREALKLKKRVIPIVLEKFDPTPPPEGIGHINWVYFTPHAGQENSFDAAFKKVIHALEADYDHSREHTRLLLRAIEWDKKARNPSYVLKGAEIEKAEGWQVAATAKEPTPTPLQGEYILTSRKIQRRQQQRFMGVIGVLMVVAAIAAVFALFQAQEAQRQKSVALDALAQAKLSAEIAHSHALSAAALQAGNEDIAESLALEAARSENAPADVFKVLEDISYRPGSIVYAHIPSASDAYPITRYPAVAPSGRYVIVGNKRYDLATGQADVTFTEVPGYILTGLYMPDGKRVILAGDDGGFMDPAAKPIAMGLYDSETGTLIHSFDTGIGVADIQLSLDSKTIVSYLPNGKVIWWDVESGDKIREFEIGGMLAFSPDLKWLASVGYSETLAGNELTLTDVESNKETLKFPIAPAFSIRFSPDSSEIAVVSGVPVIYNLADGQQIRSLSGQNGVVNSLRYSADGTMLVGAGEGGDVTVWNRMSGDIITRFTAHGVTLMFADFVRGGDGIVSMDTPGTILEWDLKPGNLIKHASLPAYVTVGALSSDAKSLILVEGCDVVTRDAATLDERNRLTLSTDFSCTPVLFADPKGDENKVFRNSSIYDDKGESALLEVLSLTTGKPLQSWTIPLISQFRQAWFLADGERILLSYASRSEDPNDYNTIPRLEMRDIASGETLMEYTVPQEAKIAVSPDGTRILFSAFSYTEDEPIYTLGMLDAVTGKEILHLNEEAADMWFSPDSKRFLTVKPADLGAYQLFLWDAETGTLIKPASGKMALPAHLVFAVDGKSVFTFKEHPNAMSGPPMSLLPSGIDFSVNYTNADEFLFLQWDLETGSLIRSFPTAPSVVIPSQDGWQLTTIAPGFVTDVFEWRLDSPQTLMSFVCANRYVPAFTAEQRAHFSIDTETSVCSSVLGGE